ncbi:TM2 domain-containing protein [Subtercola endophyticus]|uniref:TM2 domain-containing protein n=1 Tax=Subtercola endophyticus TaxID=2895559 RepID=UPI001E315E53|nr:TM2 domain-containing protein [Subtercola endophyticus]UFS57457.1 TM2 domain-containing protein [Subtercola endophyticus]
MTTLEPTPPTPSSLPVAAAPAVSLVAPTGAVVAAVPPVVVTPAAPGSSTTTVVYVNPPAIAGSGGAGAGAAGGLDATLPRPSRKGASLLTAYALFFFFGWTGMHQVYLGNTLRGVSYIFTFSWFTLALWIDLFTLPSQVRRVNTERLLGLR